jgi:hypothetical protein
VYLDLTSDPYWQGSALDSVLVWYVLLLGASAVSPLIKRQSTTYHRLQEETARVEGVLLEGWAIERIVKCFVEAKTVSFDTLIERYLRLFRLSSAIAGKVATPAFFRRLAERLGRTTRPVVRLNLLKVARTVIESQPDKAVLLRRCGVLEVVDRLAQQDDAVLVRELAKELARDLTMSVISGGRRRSPAETMR